MHIGHLDCRPRPGLDKPWLLLTDVQLTCAKHRVDLTVPAGFEWDGASVPWLFTRLLPKSSPEMLIGSCFHDWLYHHPVPQFDRERTDELFGEVLVYCGVSRWKAALAFVGVRAGGWHSYDADEV